ncbi:MAG: HipA N-terminal domain-containing protein, partial [Sulfobacillus sp.]
MGRHPKHGTLNIWMNGERVGTWRVDSRNEHELSYARSWLESPFQRPLSLSLPITSVNMVHRGSEVYNYFDNLLPDSDAIRTRLQSRFQTQTKEPMDLLAEIGRDCAGAIQLLPPGFQGADFRAIVGKRLSDDEIESILADTITDKPLGQCSDTHFRISIAGAQEKTALLFHLGEWYEPEGATPTTHIFKLPIGHVPHGI